MVRSIFAFIISLFLFLTVIVANFFQMLSVVCKPFSTKLFKRVNREIANAWWGLCESMARLTYGIEIVITGDELPVKENGIVILNHQVMTDIPVIFSLAKQKGRLGDLKWFVKDVIKYFPGVGWGMLFLDCLFIKRDWLADKDYIKQTFDKFHRYNIPIWLMCFVEGTRFTPEKAKRSHDYAQKIGMKPFNHLLIPRTKGFVASVQSLRNHCSAVYDFTIGYEQSPPPTLWQWIRGEARRVHLHVRRFDIKSLPQTDEAISQWLMDCFRQKDDLLKYFDIKTSFN